MLSSICRSGLSTGTFLHGLAGSLKEEFHLAKEEFLLKRSVRLLPAPRSENSKSRGMSINILSDQLLVPLALFGGSLHNVLRSTSHAETTIWLLGKFGYEIQHRTGTVVEFSA